MWTDADYKQFVQLYSQGAFPPMVENPTAWDTHFIPAADTDAVHRPTIISPTDFQDHLPDHLQTSNGLLILKLWEVARAKGYTNAFEQQQEEAAHLQLQKEAEAQKEKLRQEIEIIKNDPPKPEPNKPVDPRQHWYAQIIAAAPPESPLADKVRCVQQAVMDGQPFRSSVWTLPDSVDSVVGGF